jgi:uncharacterized membrane protein (UPF0127 family)
MLRDQTQDRIVIDRTRIADSAWQKFRGLMLEKEERFDYGLVFDFGHATRFGASVHMLFVFFPIDLVYLDENRRVVDVKTGFRPWSLNYTPKKAARYLIELPAGKADMIVQEDELRWA